MNSLLELYTNTPELSVEQELELVASIAAGDSAALHTLVESNLGLVVAISQKFANKGLNVDDLIGEGTLGLTRAAHGFKPGNGTRFSTYASFWIKQAITQALFAATTIQVPLSMRKAVNHWKAAQRKLETTLGRAPTSGEIAASLGFSRPQARNVRAALMARSVSLLSTIPSGGADDFQLLVSDPSLDAEQRRRERIAILHERLDVLTEREKIIVSLRYGFGDNRPKSNREIAHRLKLHRETVRQNLVRAVQKLRSLRAATPAWAMEEEASSEDEEQSWP